MTSLNNNQSWDDTKNKGYYKKRSQWKKKSSLNTDSWSLTLKVNQSDGTVDLTLHGFGPARLQKVEKSEIH